MGQIVDLDLGLLKNGFSRNPTLKPNFFLDGPMNGSTGCSWPLLMVETEYWNLLVSTGSCPQGHRNHKYFFWTNVKGANWPVRRV
jgi:hypothetical protein